jgi:hypothetical protein
MMSRHWTISTNRHFQNGHHNTAKIQHCPISSKFDMYVSIIIHLEVININVQNFNFPIGFYSNLHPLWTPQNMTLRLDNDVPNWFLTLKNFYRSPFLKWPPQYRTNPTLSDYNDISYVGRLWLWNFVEIGQCCNCVVLWQPFWKWRSLKNFQCRE